MHILLKQQLQQHLGGDGTIPAEWREFVASVEAAYKKADAEREALARSLEQKSKELQQANSEMRAMFQALPDQLFHLDRTGVILAFKAGEGDEAVPDAAKLVGRRLKEIEALHYFGEIIRAPIENALGSRSVVSTEYSTIRSGEEVFHEARIVPLASGE